MTPELSGMSPFFPEQPWKSSFLDFRSGFLFVEPRNLDEDLLALARIYSESFNGAPWFEDWSSESALKELQQCVAKGADFVIGLDVTASPVGFGVGYALSNYAGKNQLTSRGYASQEAVRQTYYIAELCTAPETRGLGVCSQVVRGLIESAGRQGYSEILTRTRSDNESMIRIFKRAGFVELGCYETETGGISSERVVLRYQIVC